jgi:FkbM family methyltransferase
MRSHSVATSSQLEESPWADRLRASKLPNEIPVWEINPHETEFLYDEIFIQDLYYRRGIELNSGAVVFDIGANIGMFSLRTRQICPDARIYAFEPSPIAAEALRRNIRSNSGETIIYECGVSAKNGSNMLTFYPGYSILSGFHAKAEHDFDVLKASIRDEAERRGMSKWLSDASIERLAQQKLGAPMRIACPMRTLSSVINEHQIRTIDFLKIDAERCELEILDGIQRTHWPLIQKIVMEVHDQEGPALDEIMRILNRHGFTVTSEQQAVGSDAGLYDVYATR